MNVDHITKLVSSLQGQAPFSLVPDEYQSWFDKAKYLKFSPGERLSRPDEISDSIFVVLKGEVRIIGFCKVQQAADQPRYSWSWSNNWLGKSPQGCTNDFVRASTDVIAVALSSSQFIDIYKSNPEFARYFDTCSSINESFTLVQSYNDSLAGRPDFIDNIVEIAGIQRFCGIIKFQFIAVFARWLELAHQHLSSIFTEPR